jgi:uncharacterized protein (PEP-CTERM system associated)
MVGRLTVLLLASTGIAAPLWADTRIVPSLDAGMIFVDNFYLVPPGTGTTSVWAEELMPHLLVQESSPNLNGILNYSAQGLLFDGQSSHEQAVHNVGAGNVSWAAVPNLLFLDARAAYTQQTVDPTQPNNNGNLFGVSNQTNELDAVVAPYLKRDFGTMTAVLRLQESISHFSGASGDPDAYLLQNSRTDLINASLATDAAEAPLAWRFDARSTRTTFDEAEPFRTDRVLAEANEGVLAALRVTESIGAETNILTHPTTGGLDAFFWSGGFKWAPSAHTELEASIGHRFFGPSYFLNWTHESRLLKYHVSYTELATTSGETIALTDFTPGQLAVDPQAYSGVLRSINTYDPYIAKQLDAGLDLVLHRTQLMLRVYSLRRDYVSYASSNLAGSSDNSYGAEIGLSRQFGLLNEVRVDARIDRADEVSDFIYHDTRYAVGYVRQLAPQMQLIAQVVRLQRDGTMQYRADIAQLTLRKTF